MTSIKDKFIGLTYTLVNNPVKHNVPDQVWKPVYYQIRAQVLIQVRRQVCDQVSRQSFEDITHEYHQKTIV
jgi:hypothetical protein